jgi:hypothetical protein
MKTTSWNSDFIAILNVIYLCMPLPCATNVYFMFDMSHYLENSIACDRDPWRSKETGVIIPFCSNKSMELH